MKKYHGVIVVTSSNIRNDIIVFIVVNEHKIVIHRQYRFSNI